MKSHARKSVISQSEAWHVGNAVKSLQTPPRERDIWTSDQSQLVCDVSGSTVTEKATKEKANASHLTASHPALIRLKGLTEQDMLFTPLCGGSSTAFDVSLDGLCPLYHVMNILCPNLSRRMNGHVAKLPQTLQFVCSLGTNVLKLSQRIDRLPN